MIFISKQSRFCTLLDFYDCENNNELTNQKAAELYEKMENPKKKFMTRQQIANEITQLRLISKFLAGKIDALTYKNFPNLKVVTQKVTGEMQIEKPSGVFQDFQSFEYIAVYSEVPNSRLVSLLKILDCENNNKLTFSKAIEIYGKTDNPNGIIFSDKEIEEGARLLITICKFILGKFDALTCQFISN